VPDSASVSASSIDFAASTSPRFSSSSFSPNMASSNARSSRGQSGPPSALRSAANRRQTANTDPSAVSGGIRREDSKSASIVPYPASDHSPSQRPAPFSHVTSASTQRRKSGW